MGLRVYGFKFSLNNIGYQNRFILVENLFGAFSFTLHIAVYSDVLLIL